MTMQTNSVAEKSFAKVVEDQNQAIPNTTLGIKIGLLTGCQDRHYAFGLAMALISKGIGVDVIGGDETDSPELHTTKGLNFLNLGGRQRQNASVTARISRLLIYYARLIRYTLSAQPKIFHVLWNSKLEYVDRTLLLLFYKLWRKKIVHTAHNVNKARRDAKDSLLNRLTLKFQYRTVDHIFVHTQKMKEELLEEFGVRERAVSVIRYPINNALPDTNLTSSEARRRLGIADAEKTILCFGGMKPYKGIEFLLDAFQQLRARDANCRLIIAGEPKKGSENYVSAIRRTIDRDFSLGAVILKAQFIPDDEIELYFKAADVLALPYKEIFQSGVLFLGYSFGLPAVATDVGSFREDIIEGTTGFVCKPNDPADMAKALHTFFTSDLYRSLAHRRQEIKAYINSRHSWDAVAESSEEVYAELAGSRLS